MAAASRTRQQNTTTTIVRDWTKLIPGDFVTVLDLNAAPQMGWIDDLTEDGATMWLVQSHGRGRRMFFREDGCRVAVEIPLPNV
jgi:hypothetical protein